MCGLAATTATVVVALSTDDKRARCESLQIAHDEQPRAEFFDSDYDTQTLLGSGTFGMVMRCVRKRDGESAAVKMVLDTFDSEDEVRREVDALRQMQQVGGHENIVRFDGSYRHNGFHYIVTEYVGGQTLYDVLQSRREGFDQATALQLTSQLISALSFLQSVELIHRDLKPENLMVLHDKARKEMKLKVIDFGSAGSIQETNHSVMLSGTRCYWAPEVLQDGFVSPAMDIWSLGCILYILLSGRHPFDLSGSSSEEQIIARATSEQLSFADPVWQHVSNDVKDLLKLLMQKSPSARITLDELRKHPLIAEHLC